MVSEIVKRVKEYLKIGEEQLKRAKEVLGLAKRMNIDVSTQERELINLEQRLVDIKTAIKEEEEKAKKKSKE